MDEQEFAELVRRRPDLAKKFEFVRPGQDGRCGYYRRIRTKWRVQVEFGETAYGVYGQRGLREGLHPAAAAVKKEMKGKRYRKSRVDEAIEKWTKAMEEMVRVTGS